MREKKSTNDGWKLVGKYLSSYTLMWDALGMLYTGSQSSPARWSSRCPQSVCFITLLIGCLPPPEPPPHSSVTVFFTTQSANYPGILVSGSASGKTQPNKSHAMFSVKLHLDPETYLSVSSSTTRPGSCTAHQQPWINLASS